MISILSEFLSTSINQTYNINIEQSYLQKLLTNFFICEQKSDENLKLNEINSVISTPKTNESNTTINKIKKKTIDSIIKKEKKHKKDEDNSYVFLHNDHPLKIKYNKKIEKQYIKNSSIKRKKTKPTVDFYIDSSIQNKTINLLNFDEKKTRDHIILLKDKIKKIKKNIYQQIMLQENQDCNITEEDVNISSSSESDYEYRESDNEDNENDENDEEMEGVEENIVMNSEEKKYISSLYEAKKNTLNIYKSYKSYEKMDNGAFKLHLKKVSPNCAILPVDNKNIYVFDFKKKIFIGLYKFNKVVPLTNINISFLNNRKLNGIIIKNEIPLY